jgi:hypothetical protein
MRTTSLHPVRLVAVVAAAALCAGMGAGLAAPTSASPPGEANRVDKDVRFATFNASLNRNVEGQLVADLSTPNNAQASLIAETIQRVNPDVLLINEFDYVAGGQAAELFRDNYLAVSHNGAPGVDYPYYFVAPSNTGVPSGFDLDNNGDTSTTDAGNDAFGFGLYEGQFGMAVFSKYPILVDDIRTFQNFLWEDMPDALLPDDPATAAPQDWYSPAELDVFRLSSKSHWDVPISIGTKTVHFLVSHPTPPVFDGAEDRNGTRNHDEIRFWSDYVSGAPAASYIYDDAGARGGLAHGARFVIAGDQNSDPLDGDSIPGATDQLLDNPRINDSHAPTSEGAVEATTLQGGANLTHRSPPQYDTADFADSAPGNLRADYVLPSRQLGILGSGVFWPLTTDPLYRLTLGFPTQPTDHRMVWVDVHLNHPRA